VKNQINLNHHIKKSRRSLNPSSHSLGKYTNPRRRPYRPKWIS